MSSSLLKEWKLKQKGQLKENTISKAPEGSPFPLSRSQQRLWFVQQLHPKSSVYNYAEIYTFSGNLMKTELIASIRAVFSENDILKTCYVLEDGDVIQNVDENSILEINEYDFSDLDKISREAKKDEIFTKDTKTHFDLSKAPLVRVSLIKTSPSEHVLLVTMHHILTDKWSMGIFREQLAKKYDQALSGNLQNEKSDIQYTDFAYWQKQNDVKQGMVDYWMEKLSGTIPELDLPVDRPPTIHHSFNGDSHTHKFSKGLSEKILKLAKDLGVTPYVFFLTVYYVFLYKYTRQKDILIGSPISNRNEPVLENMIGFFDETIVLRSEVDPSLTFGQLLSKVKKTTLDAFSNKDVPFDLLVKKLKPERSLGRNPFFRSMFIYHSVPETPSFGNDLKLEHSFFDNKVSKFDLTLYMEEEEGLLSSTMEYSTDLFNEGTIEKFQEHLHLLTEQVVQLPHEAISELNMVTSWEKEIFYSKQALKTGAFSNFNGIHEIILEHSKTKNGEAAIAFKQELVTYKELKQKAEKIAKNILCITKGKNEIVGLCAERSTDMIVGLVAILKAGCAYMPIDPEYPEERINFMLTDSKANVVVTQKNLKHVLPEYQGERVLLDEEELRPGEKETGIVDFPAVHRKDLAYVIYTSGSTGKPKGVPITHGNIIGSTEGRLEFYDENPKTFLLMSSMAFDSSKAGIFWTLCTGGKLVIAEKRLEQDIEKMRSVIAGHNVSHTLMLPSLYGLLLDHSNPAQLRSLSTIMVAGEACLPSICKKHFEKLPEVNLYNEYGPTECTVWCIAHKITRGDMSGNVPIGRAVAKAQAFLLDQDLKPVPFGAVGEIYIGGPGLALQYLHNIDLTTKAYVDSPFENGAKLYRTGDLGRFNAERNILFLGRADQQVKIRGYRIELDEIEKTMDESGQIKRAVVVIEQNNEEKPSDDLMDDPLKLLAYLEKNMDEQEVDNLLTYIEALDEKEKHYLLNQLQ